MLAAHIRYPGGVNPHKHSSGGPGGASGDAFEKNQRIEALFRKGTKVCSPCCHQP
jgi:hypothetical protein